MTGPDGVARAVLPLELEPWAPAYEWRVAATYDGDDGLLPRHAAEPIDLAFP